MMIAKNTSTFTFHNFPSTHYSDGELIGKNACEIIRGWRLNIADEKHEEVFFVEVEENDHDQVKFVWHKDIFNHKKDSFTICSGLTPYNKTLKVSAVIRRAFKAGENRLAQYK